MELFPNIWRGIDPTAFDPDLKQRWDSLCQKLA